MPTGEKEWFVPISDHSLAWGRWFEFNRGVERNFVVPADLVIEAEDAAKVILTEVFRSMDTRRIVVSILLLGGTTHTKLGEALGVCRERTYQLGRDFANSVSWSMHRRKFEYDEMLLVTKALPFVVNIDWAEKWMVAREKRVTTQASRKARMFNKGPAPWVCEPSARALAEKEAARVRRQELWQAEKAANSPWPQDGETAEMYRLRMTVPHQKLMDEYNQAEKDLAALRETPLAKKFDHPGQYKSLERYYAELDPYTAKVRHLLEIMKYKKEKVMEISNHHHTVLTRDYRKKLDERGSWADLKKENASEEE
jgi:hypothetical protein